jgi:hypothetical protein
MKCIRHIWVAVAAFLLSPPSISAQGVDLSVAAATRVVFVQQPTSSTGGAIITPAVTVQLTDKSGSNVAQSGVSIAVGLSSGTGTLSGTTTRTTNTAGLATFDDLSINLIGSKRLTASSAGLTSATSNSFTISAGPPVRLKIQTEPSATATAGIPFTRQPVLWTIDAGGNQVTTDNGTVVTAARLGGNGTLQGTLAATAVKGVVTFANLSHNVANTVTIVFTSGALIPDTSASVQIVPAAAAKLVYVQQPTGTTVGTTIAPPVTVKLQDAFGNDVTTSGTQVTMALTSGTGTLRGTLAHSTSSGIVTFGDLSINLAGTKRLTASAGTLTPAVSNPFDITPGLPNSLVFLQQPANSVAGSPIVPAVTVQVHDALGNIVPVSGISVTVVIVSGTGTLGGSATQITNASGLASFSGLTIDLAGNKALSASSPGLVTAASATFTIAEGAPAKVHFVQQPTNTVAGAAIAPSVAVRVEDSYGNTVHTAGMTVSISLPVGSGTLSGMIPQLTAVSGLAMFNSLSIDIAGTKQLTASSPGLTSSVSDSFTVSAATAAKLGFTRNPVGGTAGIPFTVQPEISVEDRFGNIATGVEQIVKVAIHNNAGPGGTLAGSASLPVNTVTGRADFNGLSIDRAGTGYTLTVTGSTLSTVPGDVLSTPFSITAGTASTVRVENSPDGTGTVLGKQNITSGMSVTVYAIARDAYANFVANTPANTWNLLNVSGGVSVSDLVAAGDRKSATFTGRVAGTASINAFVAGLSSVPSGILTVVVAGAPSRILVETDSSGMGSVVPDQLIISGTGLTVRAIGRDASGNFVSNISADKWELVNKTGGVADADLVSSGYRKSATFTGRLVGSTHIRASSGALAATMSGLITVVAGPAATVAASDGTPQSTIVSTPFPLRFAAQVRDVAGNPAKGIQVIWSAPPSGASGAFASGGAIGTTDTNGYATSGVFTANVIAGSYVVTATVAGVASKAEYKLSNTSGVGARVVAIAGSPQRTQVGIQFPVRMAASVRDSSGNGKHGVEVVFSAPTSGPSGFFPGLVRIATVSTDSAGIAIAPMFTANTVAGRFQVSASAAGITGAAIYDLENAPGPPGSIVPEAGTPESTTVASPFPTTLKARVTDLWGNALSGIMVKFVSPSSGASALFTKGTTDSTLSDTSGTAASSSLIANIVAGSYTIEARIEGIPAPAVFSLTNKPAAVDTFLIEAGGGGRLGTQIAGDTFTIRIKGIDQYGNVATGFTGTVDITSNSVLSQTSGTSAHFEAGMLSSDTLAVQNAGRCILIATRSGGAETGRTDTFLVVNPLPTVKSISPAAGMRGQTLDVSVIGTGFLTGVTSVSFGDMISTSTTVKSATELTVSTAIDAAASEGSRDIFVFNGPPGGGFGTLTRAFVVGSYPAPTLTAVVPDRGTVLHRLNLVLTGGDFFSGVTTVDMKAGITVNAITVDSANRLTADISITGSALGGIRKIAVTNPPPGGGRSDSITFIVDAPPTLYPLLDWPADAASDLDTVVSLRWHPWLTTDIVYRLQVSTSPTFASLAFEDSSVDDTVKQISTLARGVRYYWRVAARNAIGLSESSPSRSFTTSATYPATFAILDTVAFPAYSNSAEYQSTDYRLVGLPGGSGTLVSALLSGAKNADWAAYWDNGGDSDYLIAYDGSATFTFLPGRAFWVLQKGPLVIREIVPTVPLDSGRTVTIPLHPGWNLITNPLAIAVPWVSVQNANGPGTVPGLWGFRGSFTPEMSLAPCEGYLYDNIDNRTTLRIPLSPGALMRPAPVDPSEWQIDIELRAGNLVDKATSIGMSSAASNGRDPLDLRMPRGIGELPGVYFTRPTWGSRGGVFARDIRRDIDSIQIWPMDVRAPLQHEAQLSLYGVAAVPQQYGVVLIDDDRSAWVDLRANSVYRFRPAAPVSHFRIVIGNDDAVRVVVDNVLPKQFGLDNNFPNPFNPSTTIPVAIPRTSVVGLKIYSILGEEVRTLHSGPLAAGRHSFVWDSHSNQGHPVATGVYIIQLTNDLGQRYTRKMLLLR